MLGEVGLVAERLSDPPAVALPGKAELACVPGCALQPADVTT